MKPLNEILFYSAGVIMGLKNIYALVIIIKVLVVKEGKEIRQNTNIDAL
jgi:hypothetical protein